MSNTDTFYSCLVYDDCCGEVLHYIVVDGKRVWEEWGDGDYSEEEMTRVNAACAKFGVKRI